MYDAQQEAQRKINPSHQGIQTHSQYCSFAYVYDLQNKKILGVRLFNFEPKKASKKFIAWINNM